MTRGVEIWLARTDPGSDPRRLERCRDLLAPEERETASAYHREVDRRRAVVSRALLRTTLSRYARVAPADWRFERGPHGRPEIAESGANRLRFSVSHTRDLAVCAVTVDDSIGVDLEPLERDVQDLVAEESILARSEIDALRALAPRERARRFLEIWTLKEACLKAHGTGLSSPASELEFDLATPGAIVRRGPSDEDEWFALLQVGHDHVLALALGSRDGPPRLASYSVNPPEAGFERSETVLYASSSPASHG